LVSWKLPVPEYAKLSQDFVNFLLLFYWTYYNPFCLELFSFFDTYDPQVWSFDGVGEFLHNVFTALELFEWHFFSFFLI
jgi:hypothetical protein